MDFAVVGAVNTEMAPAQITPPLTALVTETRDPVEGLRQLELRACLLDVTDDGIELTLPSDVDTSPETAKFLFIGYEFQFELESRFA